MHVVGKFCDVVVFGVKCFFNGVSICFCGDVNVIGDSVVIVCDKVFGVR